MDKATPAATATPMIGLGSDWFDPLEEAVRGQVRAFIEQLLEEEVEAALGRGSSSEPIRVLPQNDFRRFRAPTHVARLRRR